MTEKDLEKRQFDNLGLCEGPVRTDFRVTTPGQCSTSALRAMMAIKAEIAG